ncbi:hypothetical protein Taro_026692 [Colocasia esculenta]|uniref:Heme O synthase n=1 Tax=Colocasia esculenta TaxID=4460 RepID=A0A843VKB7_COLES|nr:hypothetical protein [Colocasia esculenta]
MAESGRVAGSAPADPDPESGQTRPESGRVGTVNCRGWVGGTLPWVGRCPPPESGRQGPTRLRVGRLRSESADSAIHGFVGEFGVGEGGGLKGGVQGADRDALEQEIINLLLCGEAVDNIFDGNTSVDGMLLRGIRGAEIGFLTLLEVNGHCKVGKFLKGPRCPMWVVGSGNHYMVLPPDTLNSEDPSDLQANTPDEVAKVNAMGRGSRVDTASLIWGVSTSQSVFPPLVPPAMSSELRIEGMLASRNPIGFLQRAREQSAYNPNTGFGISRYSLFHGLALQFWSYTIVNHCTWTMWRGAALNFSSKLLSTSCATCLHPSATIFCSHASNALPFSIFDILPRGALFSSHLHSSSIDGSWKSCTVTSPQLAVGSPVVTTNLRQSAATSLISKKVLEATVAARHYARCYWELSKAKLSMLVVATSGAGFVLGSGRAIDLVGLSCTCVGTMMVAAAANSLNQVFEVQNDAKMKRTRQRPLPSGRLSVPHAVLWASSVGIGGTMLLASKANLLAAGLAASNLALYAFVYTPLKQIHPVNTWIGAIVGAIPPLLGWAAATGEVSLKGMILPVALYFWQIPHFMALAYLCRNDYATGGFQMFSLTDASGKRTALVSLRNCLYLLPLGYLAYDWGVTSGWFSIESSLLTLCLSAAAMSFVLDRTPKKARRMFHASLLYLPVFMTGLMLHRLPNDAEESMMMELSELDETTSEVPAWEGKSYNSTTPSMSMSRGHQLGVQARPPAAYASVAPFPFLPAPLYTSSDSHVVY